MEMVSLLTLFPARPHMHLTWRFSMKQAFLCLILILPFPILFYAAYHVLRLKCELYKGSFGDVSRDATIHWELSCRDFDLLGLIKEYPLSLNTACSFSLQMYMAYNLEPSMVHLGQRNARECYVERGW